MGRQCAGRALPVLTTREKAGRTQPAGWKKGDCGASQCCACDFDQDSEAQRGSIPGQSQGGDYCGVPAEREEPGGSRAKTRQPGQNPRQPGEKSARVCSLSTQIRAESQAVQRKKTPDVEIPGRFFAGKPAFQGQKPEKGALVGGKSRIRNAFWAGFAEQKPYLPAGCDGFAKTSSRR